MPRQEPPGLGAARVSLDSLGASLTAPRSVTRFGEAVVQLRQALAEAQAERDDPQQVHHVAARGTAGMGSSLPHLGRVQASFGAHAVGDVEAHVGGEAAAACHSLGAEAYASGRQVAFKTTPSLHTAAHEAAHVIQQRQGVALRDGLGRPRDRYEQHADAVADRVVAGRSAEGLLDAIPGGGRRGGVQAAGGRMVQLEEAPAEDTGEGENSATHWKRIDDDESILVSPEHPDVAKKVAKRKGTAETENNKDPRFRVDFIRGVQKHLGLGATSQDGSVDGATCLALMKFQFEHGIRGEVLETDPLIGDGEGTRYLPSGQIDSKTRYALEGEISFVDEELVGPFLGNDYDESAPDRVDQMRVIIDDGLDEAAMFDRCQEIVEGANGFVDLTPHQTNLLGIRGVEIHGTGLFQTNSALHFSEAKAMGRRDDHFDGNKVDWTPIETVREVKEWVEDGYVSVVEALGGEVKEPEEPEKPTEQKWPANPVRETHKDPSHEHKLDDVIIAFWIEPDPDETEGGGTKRFQVHRGSLDPNLFWSKVQEDKKKDLEGTAHVRDGQYVYKVSRHTTWDHPKAIYEWEKAVEKRIKDLKKALKKLEPVLGDHPLWGMAIAGAKREVALLEEWLELMDADASKTEASYVALRPVSLEIIREGPDTDDHHLSQEEADESRERINARDKTSKRYTKASIATNIHSSPNGRISSEGCLVIPLDEGYVDFLRTIKGNRDALEKVMVDAAVDGLKGEERREAKKKAKERAGQMLFMVIDASKIP